MRSKILGRFAKLAVAILAVGMTLTSCYDEGTENGYTPKTEDVNYVLSGTVTDSQTFAPIVGAKVTCGSLNTTTDSKGFYILKSTNTAISGAVTFSATGYNSVSTSVSLTAASPALTLNIALAAFTDHDGDKDHGGDEDHAHGSGSGQGVGGGSGE